MAPRAWPARVALGTALAGPSACSCIASSTHVRSPRGLHPIGALRIGERVWSFDVERGTWTATTIIARRVARRECGLLRFPGGELVCTPDHPIYSPETGDYEPASRWIDGERRIVLVASGEHMIARKVGDTETFVGMHEVVDITVEAALHNFVAGDVLVHNKSVITDLHNFIDGPTFQLDAAVPSRRFRISFCVDGENPHPEPFGSYGTIDISSVSEPAPPGVERLWAVSVGNHHSRTVLESPRPGSAAVFMEGMAGMCLIPLELQFDRLAGRPDDTIEVSWQVDATTLPPPGKNVDDTLDIEIEEVEPAPPNPLRDCTQQC